MHSADKLAKLIMSVWCFSVQCDILSHGYLSLKCPKLYLHVWCETPLKPVIRRRRGHVGSPGPLAGPPAEEGRVHLNVTSLSGPLASR